MEILSRLCLMFVLFTLVGAETDWEVAMAADAVHATKAPSSVVATLCWSSYKKLQLYSEITNTDNGQSGIQFIKPGEAFTQRSQDQHVLFLIDLSCENISEHLKQHSAKNHFRSPFRWILINTVNNKTGEQPLIPTAIEEMNILTDSEVLVARPTAKIVYEFYYIYKISATKAWRKEFFGIWDAHNRFQKTKQLTDSSASRRFNLDGHEITVCYVVLDNDTINHMTDEKNDHVDTITKVNYPTINHLLDFLNASKSLVYENTWGYKINGSWNGLTGQLVNNRVEIGGTPMFFISDRISIVEYIACPTPTQMKFVFQQPKLSYTSNLYLLSFKTSVWYSVLGLVFLMFLALIAVASWEWKRQKNDIETKNNAKILRGNVQDVVLLIFGAACQQGSPVELKGSLGRIVMLILFLTLMFLYTSYSANIVALLQSSSSQIRTLEDLLQSRLKLGVHDTVYNRHYFSIAADPVQKAIYEQKVAPPGVKPRFMSLEEGVKNMQKGLFAFNMELGVGYKLVNKYFKEGQKCGLHEIKFLQLQDPWQAVRKDTPYKEMYRIAFKRIHEHGLQKRENEKYYEKRPKCSGRESHFISVSMVDCYPALLMLTYGMIIALFLFVMEIILKKRQTLVKTVCCRTE